MAEFKPIKRETVKKKGFPKPIDLSEELMLALPDEQKQILFNLVDLSEKEEGLVNKINSCKPTRSGILGFPDGTITLCEDEDDWKVITLKDRQGLKTIQKQIADNLDKALNLGMGCLGIIQRQCLNYGVKP